MAALNPLLSTAELDARLGDDALRIADCRFYLAEPSRGSIEYLDGHIPGARYFSLDDHLTAASGPGRHPLPDARAFCTFVGDAGIGDQHEVVVYDDGSGGIAARMWWMLRSLGHSGVRVLDGGWAAWTSEHRRVSSTIARWSPAVFTGADEWSGIITAAQIADQAADLLLIDARAPERYRGETEPIDPIAGHIPGAINIPYEGNVASDFRFLPGDVIEARFAAAVASPKTLVGYCGSGVTACSNLLALATIGRTDVLLYPGSWSDWCTSGRPVATSA